MPEPLHPIQPPPSMPPADPYAQKMRRLEDTLLRGQGALDLATRAALATGRDIPAPLTAYAEKVTRYAYRVTDEDIAALKVAGYSEDQILEATLAIALGATQRRLAAGLGALAASGASLSTEPASAEPPPTESAPDAAAPTAIVNIEPASVGANDREQE